MLRVGRAVSPLAVAERAALRAGDAGKLAHRSDRTQWRTARGPDNVQAREVLIRTIVACTVFALVASQPGCGGCRDDGMPVVVTGSRASSTVALDPLRGLLYVANQDLPTVSVVDVRAQAVVRTLELTASARQLALSPDASRLYVTDFVGNAVYGFDTATGESIIGYAGARPYGVVTGDDGTVYVTSYGENRLHAFDDLGDELRLVRSWEIGQGDDQAPIDLADPPSRGWDPRGVAFDAVHKTVLVAHHSNQRVSRVDLATRSVDHAVFLERTDRADEAASQGVPYGLDALIVGDGVAWVPHVLWNEDVPMRPEWSVWPAVSRLDLDAELVELDRLELGGGLDVQHGSSRGLGTPIGGALTPSGELLLIACEGSAELLVVDAADGRALQAVALDGFAPRGVAVSPDGNTAYVHEAMSGTVAFVDLTGAAAGAAALVDSVDVVGDDPLEAGGLRTALALFFDARTSPWWTGSEGGASSTGRASCGACHPDGMSKTNRWFVADAAVDSVVDARYGHPNLTSGFTAYDPDLAVGDLVRMFHDQGGLLDVEPEAPSGEVAQLLGTLEAWLHGPDNLPFHGSWLTTPTGDPLPAELFEPDEACAECHAEEYASYQSSAHAHAALDEVFYLPLEAEAVAAAGDGIVTWCVGCHAPAALVTGSTLSTNGPLPEAQRRGVTCLGCHGVVGNRTGEGNNPNILDPSEALAPPYPGPDDDPTAHADAMRTPTESSFCAPCHQGFVPGSGVKEFMTYQEYLDSSYHIQGHEGEATCMDCHMPDDVGYSDHSFLSPNLHWSRTYGDDAQVARVVEFLQSAAQLDVGAPAAVPLAADIPVDVTVFNKGAGHKLPTGVSNLRELWIEATVTRLSDGVVLGATGLLADDGRLDPSALRFGKVLRDADGVELHHHEVWRVAALDDTTIPAETAVTNTLWLPTAGAVAGDQLEIRVRLRYRSLTREFVEHVQGAGAPQLDVTDLAERVVQVEVQ